MIAKSDGIAIEAIEITHAMMKMQAINATSSRRWHVKAVRLLGEDKHGGSYGFVVTGK